MSSLGSCLIEHCPNQRRVLSPVCQACARNFSYWDKKGPDAIISRQHTLEKWQDRMQYMGEHYTAKAKVKHVIHVNIEKRRAGARTRQAP